eukprot:676756-Pleurochrysis_carterae.AAC.1
MSKTRGPREVATPPCASMPSIYELATFMIMSRSGKHTRGGRGFVKKSAMLSALLRKGTVILRDIVRLDLFANEKWRRSICLVR